MFDGSPTQVQEFSPGMSIQSTPDTIEVETLNGSVIINIDDPTEPCNLVLALTPEAARELASALEDAALEGETGVEE